MERLNQWMSLMASLGVIVGIVFLAFEIQQNTESLDESRNLAIAQAQQELLSQLDDSFRSLANSEYLPSIFAKYQAQGREALTVEEFQRFVWQSCSGLSRMDTLHAWYEGGYVNAEQYEVSFRRLVLQMAPRWQDIGIWPTRPAYKKEVERILQDAQLSFVPPPSSAC